MMNRIRITSPLTPEIIGSLHVGDQVAISGVLYSARDAAHRRMVETLEKGEKLPFDIVGQTIYYMGPSPAPPGKFIGAAGPTTSGRMDTYTPYLLEAGLRAMIGKGSRSSAVRKAICKYRVIYFASLGGAGALVSMKIRDSAIIAYDDLGPEAVRRLLVEDLPAVVVNDIYGGDLYEAGKAAYRRLR